MQELIIALITLAIVAICAIALRPARPIIVHPPCNPVLERIRKIGVAPDDLRNIHRYR